MPMLHNDITNSTPTRRADWLTIANTRAIVDGTSRTLCDTRPLVDRHEQRGHACQTRDAIAAGSATGH